MIEVPPTFLEEFLQVLTNPNLVFLLLSVGVQAILIELSSPGGWVAGFIGVVCLALAAFGLGVLPVNWFGIVFLVLAFVLFVVDIKAPTHGALTAAGVGSFIVGALVLFNSPNVPGFPRVSVPLVVGTGILFGLAFTGILTFALRARSAPDSHRTGIAGGAGGGCARRAGPQRAGAARQRAVDGGAGGTRQRARPRAAGWKWCAVEGIQIDGEDKSTTQNIKSQRKTPEGVFGSAFLILT